MTLGEAEEIPLHRKWWVLNSVKRHSQSSWQSSFSMGLPAARRQAFYLSFPAGSMPNVRH